MATFRVHLSDGSKHDVDAKTPAEAGRIATAKKPVPITKIKRVKEAA